MLRCECKKSVFGILFLLCFLLGTICGVFLFGCLTTVRGAWIQQYTELLCQEGNGGLLSVCLSWCRPLLLAALAGFLRWGDRVVLFLAVLRGILMAYTAAALWTSGLTLLPFLVRGILLLPLFYAVCSWAYDKPFAAGKERKSTMRG